MEDVLTKEAQQHGHISEMMAFFQRSYPLVNKGKTLGHMLALNTFFKEYVVDHFNYEEKNVFPRVCERGTAEEKRFVESLISDHALILTDVNNFFLLFRKAEADPSSELFDQLESVSQKIIVRVIRHASREDADLFPLIQKYCS